MKTPTQPETITLTRSIRKVPRQEAFKCVVTAERSTGRSHSKSWLCKGTRNQAKGEVALASRSLTQGKNVVAVNIK